MTYRSRFAPSPTGPLYAGSLVSALASFLDARAHGGSWIVRIEDVDEPRTVPDAADEILATLAHFGMHSDEPPVWLSTRGDAYQRAFDRLQAEGLVYPCSCTRHEIADSDSVARAPRNAGLSWHLPQWPQRQTRARMALARARWRRGACDVHRSLARVTDAGSRQRSRRFRTETRGRIVGLSTGGGRRRCGRRHHARRGRRRFARFDRAADLLAAVSRRAAAVVSACARREQSRWRKAQQTNRRGSAGPPCAARCARARRAASGIETAETEWLDSFYAEATAQWARRIGQ